MHGELDGEQARNSGLVQSLSANAERLGEEGMSGSRDGQEGGRLGLRYSRRHALARADHQEAGSDRLDDLAHLRCDLSPGHRRSRIERNRVSREAPRGDRYQSRHSRYGQRLCATPDQVTLDPDQGVTAASSLSHRSAVSSHLDQTNR